MNFFPIPSLSACVTAARLSFRAYLPGSDAWVWPNNIGPTAKVIGGALWEAFKRLDYVGKQAFALFAVGKYLDYHGAEFDLPRKLAKAAAGNVILTSTDAIGVVEGAQFQRGDGVLTSATESGALGGAGNLTIPVVANVAAQAGNTQPGAPMTIVSGVTGPGAATATAAVDSNGLTSGLDVEDDGPERTSDLSTYRGRILFRKRNPPQGGAAADYVAWASAVPGVTRVYVERRWAGSGTVRVFPIFDGLFAGAGGVADAGHIAEVAAAIAPLAPAGAAVDVAAPNAQPIAVNVHGLAPNTAAAQAAVLAELADAFQRLGAVAGADTSVASMPFLAVPYAFEALWIQQAVADASGVTGGSVSAPSADTTIAAGSIPTLGAVTFV